MPLETIANESGTAAELAQKVLDDPFNAYHVWRLGDVQLDGPRVWDSRTWEGGNWLGLEASHAKEGAPWLTVTPDTPASWILYAWRCDVCRQIIPMADHERRRHTPAECAKDAAEARTRPADPGPTPFDHVTIGGKPLAPREATSHGHVKIVGSWPP